jgi:putative hydrolase of the HAD superfamily
MKPKLVVFDLYDTLVRIKSSHDVFFKIVRLLDKNNMTVEDFFKEGFSKIMEKLNISEQKIAELNRLIKFEVDSVSLFEETGEVIDTLKKRGFKLGLISNVYDPYIKPFFELGLNDFFDFTIFSCEVGMAKPEPEIYHKMSELSDLSFNEMAMVGDSFTSDYETPASLGINSFWLNRDSIPKNNKEITNLNEILEKF